MRAGNPRSARGARSGSAFTSAFGNRDLDATTLLLPELGLLPATDPRFLKTLERIEEELRVGDLLFRYKHADDFGTPENAFTICAFWYVNALAAAGRVDEARERFSRLLERRNPLGLLSEDIAPATGELWGNFPQTYSMVGVIGSALAPVAQLGGNRMSRLVAVSNRISVPEARRRPRAGSRWDCSPRCRRAAACGSVGTARPPKTARPRSPRWSARTASPTPRSISIRANTRISISASAMARCGRCSTISSTASVTTTRTTRRTSA